MPSYHRPLKLLTHNLKGLVNATSQLLPKLVTCLLLVISTSLSAQESPKMPNEENASPMTQGQTLLEGVSEQEMTQTTTTESVTTEQIIIPLGQQAPEKKDQARPERGMSEALVIQTYGEPEHKTPAVGSPPISTWTYDNFSVYFESGYVIHSVLRHKKMPEPTNEPEPTEEPSTEESTEQEAIPTP